MVITMYDLQNGERLSRPRAKNTPVRYCRQGTLLNTSGHEERGIQFCKYCIQSKFAMVFSLLLPLEYLHKLGRLVMFSKATEPFLKFNFATKRLHGQDIYYAGRLDSSRTFPGDVH